MAIQWDQWLNEFERMETGIFGTKLRGPERDETLYRLFSDGYSPHRAMRIVRLSVRLDSLSLISITAVIFGLASFINCVLSALDGTPISSWWFSLVFFVGVCLYLVWVRVWIKELANLLSSAKPDHLKAVK